MWIGTKGKNKKKAEEAWGKKWNQMWFDDFYWAQVRLETPGNFYNIFEHLSQQKVFLEEKKSQFRMVWNTTEIN